MSNQNVHPTVRNPTRQVGWELEHPYGVSIQPWHGGNARIVFLSGQEAEVIEWLRAQADKFERMSAVTQPQTPLGKDTERPPALRGGLDNSGIVPNEAPPVPPPAAPNGDNVTIPRQLYNDLLTNQQK